MMAAIRFSLHRRRIQVGHTERAIDKGSFHLDRMNDFSLFVSLNSQATRRCEIYPARYRTVPTVCESLRAPTTNGITSDLSVIDERCCALGFVEPPYLHPALRLRVFPISGMRVVQYGEHVRAGRLETYTRGGPRDRRCSGGPAEESPICGHPAPYP